MIKNFLTSKTIWFGIAQIIFAGIGYFTGWIDSSASTSLFITGIGTLGFRSVTTTPVTLGASVPSSRY